MNVRSYKPPIFLSTIMFLLLGGNSIIHASDPFNIKDPGPPIITEESIIFRFKGDLKAPKLVMVNGEFNKWEEPLIMVKNRNDVFIYIYNKRREKSIVIDEGQYAYRYLVDGVWMKDPHNENVVYDRYGTELSFFKVPSPIIIAEKNPVPVRYNDYIFYYKNRNAKDVRIVGDFNNWNPYSHPMSRNKSGLWEVTMDIPPGIYLYRLIVDGVFKTDPLNKNLVKDHFNNEFSALQLPLQ